MPRQTVHSRCSRRSFVGNREPRSFKVLWLGDSSAFPTAGDANNHTPSMPPENLPDMATDYRQSSSPCPVLSPALSVRDRQRQAFPSRSRRPIPQVLPAADAHHRADRFDRRQFPEKAAKREVAEFVFRNPIQPVHSVPPRPRLPRRCASLDAGEVDERHRADDGAEGHGAPRKPLFG